MADSREPKCTHNSDGRMSWPVALDSSPSASTYVCARPECLEDAALWVEECTGTRGVFVPWRSS